MHGNSSFVFYFKLYINFDYKFIYNYLYVIYLFRDPIKSEAELRRAGASEIVEFDFTKPGTKTLL